jgi:para-aminobenzoate synthetase component 1
VTETGLSRAVRAVVEPLGFSPRVEDVVTRFGDTDEAAILESVRPDGTYGRWSLFADRPVAIAIADASDADPLETLIERLGRLVPPPDADGARELSEGTPAVPFLGGWVGYVGYEAGRVTACTSPRPVHPAVDSGAGARGWEPTGDLPLARFAFYDTAVVHDAVGCRWYLTAMEWPAGARTDRGSARERLEALRSRLRGVVAGAAVRAPRVPTATDPTANMSLDAYRSKVHRALEHIRAGDIYQVNLARRWTALVDATPLELYLRLRRMCPVPHAALLRWGDSAVLSASPELFLHLRDGHVVTRPIKGTRPRGRDERADAKQRRALLTSEKDAAELNMIIDLLRNDLGRVCAYGSVRVRQRVRIERHPNVLHRVATVEGRLTGGAGWSELLRATFPGGSITGCPKIRAMQIIRELEPTPRGVYCGAIGTIGWDGSMRLNVAIRTMVQQGDAVHLYAGGAITADSDPEQEHREIMAKASGMLHALNCRIPDADS